MSDASDQLRLVATKASADLGAISSADSSRRPAPGKWSAREVVGHLIDSAVNNHRRIVLAQLKDDLIFTGYDHEGWVSAQQYQEANWDELVALWLAMNLNLVRIMQAVPDEVRLRPVPEHNLYEISWRKAPSDQPGTLDYLMTDYVGHLVHHLRQVLGARWAPAG